MNANFTLETFALRGSAIHVAPDANTSVLRGDNLKPRLQQLPGGLLLAAFQIALDSDTHPHMWEMHPAGDEILVMVTGALAVEYADGDRRGRCSLGTGQAVVMPRGVWHRLELREPGLLLTLTPIEGTLHDETPGGRQ
jgi:mannose-6-phosphate isomerase-like protein (cupin superfamily)